MIVVGGACATLGNSTGMRTKQQKDKRIDKPVIWRNHPGTIHSLRFKYNYSIEAAEKAGVVLGRSAIIRIWPISENLD